MDSVVNSGFVIVTNNVTEGTMTKITFKRKVEPSMVTHSCNPNSRRLRQ